MLCREPNIPQSNSREPAGTRAPKQHQPRAQQQGKTTPAQHERVYPSGDVSGRSRVPASSRGCSFVLPAIMRRLLPFEAPVA